MKIRWRVLLAVVAVVWFAAPSSAAEICWPQPGKITITLGGWEVENYKWADVPPAAMTTKPYIGWFTDTCTKKLTAGYFNKQDWVNIVEQMARKTFTSSASINAWAASQPPDPPRTAADSAYLKVFFTAMAPKLAVMNMSNGTAPAYTLNSDGTRNTTAVSGVRIPANVACDGTQRIGTTDYYFVPNVVGTTGYYTRCAAPK